MQYDFRKNAEEGGSQFSFTAEEIKNDPVLSHVAAQLNVTEGSIEVDAESKEDAFELFFGVKPSNAISLSEDVCPDMSETDHGYHGEGYEILDEEIW